jgi:IS5 family transposase
LCPWDKCQFDYRKTRYKGLDKNAAQVFSLMALANLYQARVALLMAAYNCALDTPKLRQSAV